MKIYRILAFVNKFEAFFYHFIKLDNREGKKREYNPVGEIEKEN